MSNRNETGPQAIPSRRAALRGAVVASFVLVAVAAARGYADLWMMLGALLAIGMSLLVAGQTQSLGTPLRSAKETRQQGLAETALAHIPDPIILVDRRALVVEANDAARRLLPGLKTGHPLSFALRSPDVLDGIGAALSSAAAVRIEYSERVPTERTFEVHIGPVEADAAGADTPTGAVLFFRDLTSARRLEAMRADFVANASHELRTPLASVLGFIDTLQGPARDDPKARERFLGIMREQAQRMKRLIDDLLSLSRIEMRAHVSPTQPNDLKGIVTHMVEMLSPLARERGVALNVKLPDHPVLVRGDRDELLRVVENLVENAVKYGESGRLVDVELAIASASADPSPEKVTLSVQDYGPGIAPEHLPRLTERFYRVDVAQSREKGGTGLGLAIVKHIVNRHHGQLTIASEPGQGARFTVTLPRA